jgi:hypothetical protein
MKRYWKIILLCFVAAIAIGTFYISSGFADQKNITIEFEKVNGNEDELNDLTILGDYLVGNIYHSLKIQKGETIDNTNRSFFEQLDKTNVSPVFKGLVENYSGFFRSKHLDPGYFFENEELLAYAGLEGENVYVNTMSEITFDIDVLNKETKKTTSIESDVPGSNQYGWMDVGDVQVIDDEIKVFIRGFRKDEGNDLLVYTFNINEQKLVSHETYFSTPEVESGWADLRMVNDHGSIHQEKYQIIIMETYDDQNAKSMDGGPTLVANEVLIYNIESNQSEALTVPDEMLGLNDSPTFTLFGTTIYMYNLIVNGLEVNYYDIETGKWGEKRTFNLPDQTYAEDAPYFEVLNGKAYIISAFDKGHKLLIADTKTGETLYEGNLTVKNKKGQQKDYHLYFHEMIQGDGSPVTTSQ